MTPEIDQHTLNLELLESIFRTSKKTVQEYLREIERYCRFKSVHHQVINGTVLDDRGRLMDLYEACVQQDAHLSGVLETLESQIVGERYMLARQNDKGRYQKDIEESKKIQGTQFTKIIRGIAEAKLYGYTGIEINPEIDPRTGKLAEVNIIERRNILPDQKRIVQRQGIWSPGWDFTDPKYEKLYILINSGTLGLFSATTPLVLAKKFTLANYINFAHTYGQPIIHGKTESESQQDRQRLANEIASAAQNKVLVTPLTDEVDIKTFQSSGSDYIFTGLIEQVNAEVSNLILGSESMAGATQSYVGATKAHQDIFRDRIAVYREYIENVMNEEVIPRLVAIGYIKPGLEFKYSGRMEMSNKEQIELFAALADRFEVPADEIEKTFGVVVGKQINAIEAEMIGGAAAPAPSEIEEVHEEREEGTQQRHRGKRRMSQQEYRRRYGIENSVNFLKERK